MSTIPSDIINRLQKDYPNPNDYEDALDVLNHVKNDTLNVGWVQLVRSMIILAEGDIKTLKNIKRSGYMGDPRDVIMSMMGKPNSNNDHGLTPFEN